MSVIMTAETPRLAEPASLAKAVGPDATDTLPEIVQIPREIYIELFNKAQIYDLLAASEAAILPFSGNSNGTNNRRSFVSNEQPQPRQQAPGNKPPPEDKTLIVGPLPLNLKIGDLVHSFIAPGGLQKLHFSVLPDTSYQVAVITFMSATGAAGYKSYVDKNGFFLSLRVKEGEQRSDGGEVDGETRTGVMQSLPEGRGVKKVFLIKKHMVKVMVRFWGKDVEGAKLERKGALYCEVENSLLRWYSLNDDWFCKTDDKIDQGATRVLRVLESLDVVLHELSFLKFSPHDDAPGGCSFEFVSHGIRGPKTTHKTEIGQQQPATMLRFFSLREAIMAKQYFSMHRGFERKAFYAKDISDRDTKALNWDTYSKVGGTSKTEKMKQEEGTNRRVG